MSVGRQIEGSHVNCLGLRSELWHQYFTFSAGDVGAVFVERLLGRVLRSGRRWYHCGDRELTLLLHHRQWVRALQVVAWRAHESPKPATIYPKVEPARHM